MPRAFLDPDAHRTSIEYDALNRVKRMRYPQAVDSHHQRAAAAHNRAGALEQVSLDDAVPSTHRLRRQGSAC